MEQAQRGCRRCGNATMIRHGATPAGVTRWECNKPGCRYRTTDPYIRSTDIARAVAAPQAHKDRLVITSAQNATGVNLPFLRALERFCEHRDAQLIVVPFRYRNPTSMWTSNDEGDDWWDERLTPYLCDSRVALTDRLVLLGDIKVQPTAINPLTGFDALTGASSGIIAHPKVALRCIPTPHKHLPKIMVSTGAVTQQNYTDSRAGKRGEFHHTFGALVVELDGDAFHVRHLNAVPDGSFHDLRWRYTARRVEDNGGIEALVMGDTHADFVDPDVEAATFDGPDSIVATLQPKTFVWHDLLDFYSKNHHHKNPFTHVAKRAANRDDVFAEVERAVAFLDKYTPPGVVSVLVPSNHNEALNRWVQEADWKADPTNAITYLETALHMARTSRWTGGGVSYDDPFHYWITRLSKKLRQIRLLHRDETYLIKGIEVSMHGDIGPNGARGSVQSLSKIGAKSIIGHSHTPGIVDGCYQVGTSSRLRLEYNSGPSSWLHTHAIVYKNGKRALINIIGGRWTTTNFKEVGNESRRHAGKGA